MRDRNDGGVLESELLAFSFMASGGVGSGFEDDKSWSSSTVSMGVGDSRFGTLEGLHGDSALKASSSKSDLFHQTYISILKNTIMSNCNVKRILTKHDV